ncbi:MAG: hypothetical protein GPJ54_07350 [Candidatus Heimdallarchaeota archaeon]|nr:hypothetical protein [Candidatus Heimdallarchaeota archaeon]
MEYNHHNINPIKLRINLKQHFNEKIQLENSHAIRTRLRGLLFLAIALMQPAHRILLEDLGYSRRTITNFTREAKKEGILRERGFLFSLTDEGQKIKLELVKDTYMASWYSSVVIKDKIGVSSERVINAGS